MPKKKNHVLKIIVLLALCLVKESWAQPFPDTESFPATTTQRETQQNSTKERAINTNHEFLSDLKEGICREGWVKGRVNNVAVCLKANSEPLSWDEAQHECRKDFSFLVKMEAPITVESMDIIEYLRKHNMMDVWTGLHEEYQHLVWDEITPHKVRAYNDGLESELLEKRAWDWDVDEDEDDSGDDDDDDYEFQDDENGSKCGNIKLSSVSKNKLLSKKSSEEKILRRHRRQTEDNPEKEVVTVPNSKEFDKLKRLPNLHFNNRRIQQKQIVPNTEIWLNLKRFLAQQRAEKFSKSKFRRGPPFRRNLAPTQIPSLLLPNVPTPPDYDDKQNKEENESPKVQNQSPVFRPNSRMKPRKTIHGAKEANEYIRSLRGSLVDDVEREIGDITTNLNEMLDEEVQPTKMSLFKNKPAKKIQVNTDPNLQTETDLLKQAQKDFMGNRIIKSKRAPVIKQNFRRRPPTEVPKEETTTHLTNSKHEKTTPTLMPVEPAKQIQNDMPFTDNIQVTPLTMGNVRIPNSQNQFVLPTPTIKSVGKTLDDYQSLPTSNITPAFKNKTTELINAESGTTNMGKNSKPRLKDRQTTLSPIIDTVTSTDMISDTEDGLNYDDLIMKETSNKPKENREVLQYKPVDDYSNYYDSITVPAKTSIPSLPQPVNEVNTTENKLLERGQKTEDSFQQTPKNNIRNKDSNVNNSPFQKHPPSIVPKPQTDTYAARNRNTQRSENDKNGNSPAKAKTFEDFFLRGRSNNQKSDIAEISDLININRNYNFKDDEKELKSYKIDSESSDSNKTDSHESIESSRGNKDTSDDNDSDENSSEGEDADSSEVVEKENSNDKIVTQNNDDTDLDILKTGKVLHDKRKIKINKRLPKPLNKINSEKVKTDKSFSRQTLTDTEKGNKEKYQGGSDNILRMMNKNTKQLPKTVREKELKLKPSKDKTDRKQADKKSNKPSSINIPLEFMEDDLSEELRDDSRERDEHLTKDMSVEVKQDNKSTGNAGKVSNEEMREIITNVSDPKPNNIEDTLMTTMEPLLRDNKKDQLSDIDEFYSSGETLDYDREIEKSIHRNDEDPEKNRIPKNNKEGKMTAKNSDLKTQKSKVAFSEPNKNNTLKYDKPTDTFHSKEESVEVDDDEKSKDNADKELMSVLELPPLTISKADTLQDKQPKKSQEYKNLSQRKSNDHKKHIKTIQSKTDNEQSDQQKLKKQITTMTPLNKIAINLPPPPINVKQMMVSNDNKKENGDSIEDDDDDDGNDTVGDDGDNDTTQILSAEDVSVFDEDDDVKAEDYRSSENDEDDVENLKLKKNASEKNPSSESNTVTEVSSLKDIKINSAEEDVDKKGKNDDDDVAGSRGDDDDTSTSQDDNYSNDEDYVNSEESSSEKKDDTVESSKSNRDIIQMSQSNAENIKGNTEMQVSSIEDGDDDEKGRHDVINNNGVTKSKDDDGDSSLMSNVKDDQFSDKEDYVDLKESSAERDDDSTEGLKSNIHKMKKISLDSEKKKHVSSSKDDKSDEYDDAKSIGDDGDTTQFSSSEENLYTSEEDYVNLNESSSEKTDDSLEAIKAHMPDNNNTLKLDNEETKRGSSSEDKTKMTISSADVNDDNNDKSNENDDDITTSVNDDGDTSQFLSSREHQYTSEEDYVNLNDTSSEKTDDSLEAIKAHMPDNNNILKLDNEEIKRGSSSEDKTKMTISSADVNDDDNDKSNENDEDITKSVNDDGDTTRFSSSEGNQYTTEEDYVNLNETSSEKTDSSLKAIKSHKPDNINTLKLDNEETKRDSSLSDETIMIISSAEVKDNNSGKSNENDDDATKSVNDDGDTTQFSSSEDNQYNSEEDYVNLNETSSEKTDDSLEVFNLHKPDNINTSKLDDEEMSRNSSFEDKTKSIISSAEDKDDDNNNESNENDDDVTNSVVDGNSAPESSSENNQFASEEVYLNSNASVLEKEDDTMGISESINSNTVISSFEKEGSTSTLSSSERNVNLTTTREDSNEDENNIDSDNEDGDNDDGDKNHDNDGFSQEEEDVTEVKPEPYYDVIDDLKSQNNDTESMKIVNKGKLTKDLRSEDSKSVNVSKLKNDEIKHIFAVKESSEEKDDTANVSVEEEDNTMQESNSSDDDASTVTSEDNKRTTEVSSYEDDNSAQKSGLENDAMKFSGSTDGEALKLSSAENLNADDDKTKKDQNTGSRENGTLKVTNTKNDKNIKHTSADDLLQKQLESVEKANEVDDTRSIQIKSKDPEKPVVELDKTTEKDNSQTSRERSFSEQIKENFSQEQIVSNIPEEFRTDSNEGEENPKNGTSVEESDEENKTTILSKTSKEVEETNAEIHATETESEQNEEKKINSLSKENTQDFTPEIENIKKEDSKEYVPNDEISVSEENTGLEEIDFKSPKNENSILKQKMTTESQEKNLREDSSDEFEVKAKESALKQSAGMIQSFNSKEDDATLSSGKSDSEQNDSRSVRPNVVSIKNTSSNESYSVLINNDETEKFSEEVKSEEDFAERHVKSSSPLEKEENEDSFGFSDKNVIKSDIKTEDKGSSEEHLPEDTDGNISKDKDHFDIDLSSESTHKFDSGNEDENKNGENKESGDLNNNKDNANTEGEESKENNFLADSRRNTVLTNLDVSSKNTNFFQPVNEDLFKIDKGSKEDLGEKSIKDSKEWDLDGNKDEDESESAEDVLSKGKDVSNSNEDTWLNVDNEPLDSNKNVIFPNISDSEDEEFRQSSSYAIRGYVDDEDDEIHDNEDSGELFTINRSKDFGNFNKYFGQNEIFPRDKKNFILISNSSGGRKHPKRVLNGSSNRKSINFRTEAASKDEDVRHQEDQDLGEISDDIDREETFVPEDLVQHVQSIHQPSPFPGKTRSFVRVRAKKAKMRLSGCKLKRRSVCFSYPVNVDNRASSCDPGWIGHVFQDKCYRAMSVMRNTDKLFPKLPYASARAYCKSIKARVADLHDGFGGKYIMMVLLKSMEKEIPKGSIPAIWGNTDETSLDMSCNAYTTTGRIAINCTLSSLAVTICEKSAYSPAVSHKTHFPNTDTQVDLKFTGRNRLECPLRSNATELPILWFKDGRMVDIKVKRRIESVLPHEGGRPISTPPEPAVSTASSLILDSILRQTLQTATNQFIGNEAFQGRYWCEAWKVSHSKGNNSKERFQREKSPQILVRFADVMTFVGTIKLPTIPYTERLLHNKIEMNLPPVLNIMSDINYINSLIFPKLQPDFPDIAGISSYPGDIMSEPLNRLQFRVYFKMANNYTLTSEMALYKRLLYIYRELMNDTKALMQLPNRTPMHIIRTMKIRSTVSCQATRLIDRKSKHGASFYAAGTNTHVPSVEICNGKKAGSAKCIGGFQNGAYWTDISITQLCGSPELPDVNSGSEEDDDEKTKDDDDSYENLAKRLTSEERLKELAEMDVEDNNAENVIEETAEIAEEEEDLSEMDINYISEIMEKSANIKRKTKYIVAKALQTINRVMTVEQKQTIKSKKSSSIIKNFEKMAEDTDLDDNGYFRMILPNVAMEIYELQKYRMPVIGMAAKTDENGRSVYTPFDQKRIFTLYNDTEIYNDIDVAIHLPSPLIHDVKQSTNHSKLFMMVYKHGSMFQDSSVPVMVGREVRLDGSNNLKTINSYVISASIGGRKIQGLTEKVKTIFRPLKDPGDKERSCAFYDFTLNSNGGGWSSAGCVYDGTLNGRDVCLCDHLTNFAVLIDFYGQAEPVDREHEKTLSIISLIGLSLSILGLSLTIISFVFFRKLRQGRAQQTLFNLALSMLCSWVIFLVGIKQTYHYIGCLLVAILLHYFILSSFMWMLMEAFLQYLTFVKVLGTYVRRYTLKSVLAAWGLPLIPIISVLSIDYELYKGGDNYCWMSLQAFYYAFAVPVGLIILCNLVIFVITVVSIFRRPQGLRSNQSKHKMAITNLQAAITSFVLLGLSWILGYFAISDARLPFQYAFTILNSLQGFFIFVLFVARKKQVREQWIMICCCRYPDQRKAQRSLSASASIPSTCSSRSSSSTTALHGRQDRSDSCKTTTSFIGSEYDSIYTVPYSRASRDSLYFRKL